MKERTIFVHYLRHAIALLIMGIGLTLGISYLFAEKSLVSTVQKGLEYHSDFRKERILSQYSEQKEWLEKISMEVGFVENAENLLNAYLSDSHESDRYVFMQEQFRREYRGTLLAEGINDLFLITAEGELAFSLRSQDSEIGELITADGFYGRTILSDLYEEVSTERHFGVSRYGKIELVDSATVLFAVPLFSVYGGNPSEFIGVLVRPFSLDRIRALISSYSGLGETGEVTIGQRRIIEEGGDVTFINHFRGDRVPDAACIVQRLNEHEKFSISVPLEEHRDDIGWRLDNSCTSVYAVSSWIPELRWAMVVKQDKDEILAPIKDLQQQLLVTLIPLIILLLWLVHRQSKIFSYPLTRLVQSIDENRVESLPRDRVKEVNTLTQSLQTSMNALQEAVKSAEQANKTKDDFLATMSHELRTPLTAIIGNAELATEKVDDEALMELIDSISLAGRGQLVLVNDILDMSKIDSGKLTIEEAPYDFNALMQELERLFIVVAQDAGNRLTTNQKKPEPNMLIGDKQRIMQILNNLISNAIKFTADGEVVVSSCVEGELLMIQVRDTGIGMSQAIVDKLFNPFEQADGSISRRFGGSGLGLYISQRLAEMMGGKIEATSREGEGSTFKLTLPYQPSEIELEERASAQSRMTENLTGNVLLAEDTPLIQKLERAILMKMGLTVDIANNGLEAIEMAAMRTYDLILMDMQMPELDGIEATRLLRERGETTPIIALTANVMQKHREAFEAAGCDDFLGKPIDQEKLAKVLGGFLSH